jgi:autoinducer 2-degrading protein
MFAVIVEFRIQAAHVQTFRHAIVDNARQPVEREAGCYQFDVGCDPADPALFFLYEIYDSAEGFAKHLQAPHFLEFDQATRHIFESTQVRQMQRPP